MNDRAVSLLDQYDITVNSTKKGRDAILCDTDKGCCIFKEYFGHKDRLVQQSKLLTHIRENGFTDAEEILPTKEGELSVKDRDGVDYILKTYVEGRECNIQNPKEPEEAVCVLSRLHDAMAVSVEETDLIPEGMGVFSPLKEYEKKNRELLHIRKYLKGKGQKNSFEHRLCSCYDYFLDQAGQVTEKWRAYDNILCSQRETAGKLTYCHGDFQYHNILNHNGNWFIINFEKFVMDNPIRDLYLLLRKLMEKNDWSFELGTGLIESYGKNRFVSDISKLDLYYRLAYPDKFRKIVNYYYNSRKYWIPEKNLEKLEKLLMQEEKKQAFLREAFHI